jgi:hypothetical protein
MENLEEKEKNTKSNSKRKKSQTKLKLTPKDPVKSENKARVLSKGKNLPPIMGMTAKISIIQYIIRPQHQLPIKPITMHL